MCAEVVFAFNLISEILPDRLHLIEGVVVIERIVLGLEMKDVTQFLVRSEQMSFTVVECQSDNRLLKHLAVFVRQFLFFFVEFQLVCNVCQCTEEVRWSSGCLVGIFCDALFLHVTPFSQMLFATYIPSEDTFCIAAAANDEVCDETSIDLMVFRVDGIVTLLI